VDKAYSSTRGSSRKLAGRVEKIIPSRHPGEPEKAQVSVEEADHLYKEIRIENQLKDDSGKAVRLKPGAEVNVKIEADADAIEQSDEKFLGTRTAPRKFLVRTVLYAQYRNPCKCGVFNVLIDTFLARGIPKVKTSTDLVQVRIASCCMSTNNFSYAWGGHTAARPFAPISVNR
jgi:hypothetical protein